MVDVRAAGGAVWRRAGSGDGIEVLVVHRPRYDDWSLPKGKCADQESDEDCAHREVLEETGLECELGDELPETHYVDRHGRPKHVRYWAMTPAAGDFVPNDEVDRAEWLAVDNATARLTYDHDLAVVVALARPRDGGDLMAVLLVRHAKAGDRSSWSGADEERPLSGKGRRQAEGLIEILGDWKPDRVLSSPFTRCIQTVEPIAKKHGVRVRKEPLLGEGANARHTVRLIDELLTNGDAVLCSHGDVIPMVIDVLVDRDGLQLPDDAGWAKGSTWVLEGAPGHITSARYLPPPL